MRKPVAVFACALLAALLVPGVALAQEEVVLELEQEVIGLDGNGFLIPGTTELDIELTINQTEGNKTLTALGIEFVLPAGWTFASFTSDAPAPNLAPAAGSSGDQNFVWFAPIPSTYPYSLTYTVNLPASEEGPIDYTNTLLYRTDGPEFSDSASTTIQTPVPLELDITLERSLAGDGLAGPNNEFYVAGESIEITVDFTAEGDKTLTALGLTESLPTGWTFGSVISTTGPNPNIAPVAGATGNVEFAWFAPLPTFPYSITYSVDIPASADGQACLSVVSEYRTDGGSLFSNTVETCLDAQPCLEIARVTQGGDFYVAGGEVTFEVTVSGACPSPITAFAVEEQIPAGWSFVSVGGPNQPNLAPTAGDEDTLEFIYFTIPALPFAFSYTVAVPADEEGDREVSGQGIYRLAGPELRTAIVTTTLSGEDVTPPVITLLGDAEVTIECGDTFDDPGATAEDDRDGDITDQIVVGGDTVDTSTPGVYVITYNVSDAAGNDADEVIRTVTVVDTTPPTAIAQDITAELGANGQVTITAAQVDNGSFDTCGGVTLAVAPSTFTCADIGDNAVTLTVTDEAGLESTATATVTVVDLLSPTVVTQNITVQLDANGEASITADQVDGGSTDNCAIATRTVAPNTFTCADLGANSVTLTVTDTSGNQATGTATVTVEDNIDPTVVTQNITVQLGANGQASITAAQVDGGSTDNCAIATRTVAPSSFTCADIGANTVTLTVTDTSGNQATGTATVTVEDNIDPTAVCQDITVQLGADGTVSITAEQVDGGSTDNCSIVTRTVTPSSFTCADIGANTVTLTVTDASGNSSTCTATVTVEDNLAPVVVCQDISIDLGADNTATITADDVVASATDNCGDVTLSVTPSSFTCADVGANTVTVTATDASGNTSTCTAVVTVNDTQDPVAVCADITVELDANGTATITAADVDGGSTDNCGIESRSVVPSSFTCADIGANVVTLTVMDASGNTSTCTATVTVVDNLAPEAVCQNIEVALGADGTVTITADDVDGGSADNCAIASRTVSPDTFTCADLGANTVTLTVTDSSGNTSTCTATVVVTDPDEICGDEVFCDLDAVTLTSPTGDVLIGQGQEGALIDFTSNVEIGGEAGCITGTIEVEYFLNGNSIGTSTDAASGFLLTSFVPIGAFGVVAQATDLESLRTASSPTFTFSVRTGRDQNDDGYLDYPFEDLPNDGDSWLATVDPGTGCDRTVAMTTWFADVPGDPIRLSVANPEDPNQTASLLAPRSLLLPGEQGILVLSIACNLESLFSPQAFDSLADGLPAEELVAGTPTIEILLLVLPQGETEFFSVRDLTRGGLLPNAGVDLTLNGLNFTAGFTPTFQKHATAIDETDSDDDVCPSCFIVVGDQDEFSDDGVASPRRRGTTLSATLRTLSTVVATEAFTTPPTLEVTPDPNFEVLLGIVTIGDSASANVSIRNVGSGVVSGAASLNGPEGVFSLAGADSPQYNLATGQTATFTVEFTPQAAGDFLAILTLTGSSDGPKTINVRGTGSARADKERVILGCGGAQGASGTRTGDLAVLLAVLLGLGAMTWRRRQLG